MNFEEWPSPHHLTRVESDTILKMNTPSDLSAEEIEQVFRLLHLETGEQRRALSFDLIPSVQPAIQLRYTTNAENKSLQPTECQTSVRS